MLAGATYGEYLFLFSAIFALISFIFVWFLDKKDKVILFQEELVNSLTEQMNKKMYILAILSAIFLPLTFLTGLLGINVGGIPGANHENAFYIFIAILLCIVGFQFFIFKKNKWI